MLSLSLRVGDGPIIERWTFAPLTHLSFNERFSVPMPDEAKVSIAVSVFVHTLSSDPAEAAVMSLDEKHAGTPVSALGAIKSTNIRLAGKRITSTTLLGHSEFAHSREVADNAKIVRWHSLVC